MRGTSESTPTRRTVLSTLGAGLAGGLLATGTGTARQSDSQYALVQDDTCVPVRPIRGQLTAETFYGYHLPEQYVADANGAVASERLAYSSAGTTDLQRAKTSIAFLYQGPRGLSLVFVHGKAGADDGGSVTFRLSGVPSGAEWVVKDDLYGDLDGGDLQNYDRWQVDGSDQQVDWTWGSGGTDGGVLRGLGEEFEVVVRPAFNEAAALYGEYYEGTVTDWQFLSGSVAVSKRVPLDLGKPIRIRTGGCEGDSGSDESGQQSGAQGHQSQSQNQDDDDDSDGDDGDEDDGDDDDDSEDGDDGDEDDGDDDDDEGRGPPDHAEGRGPPDHAEGRGPPDRAEGDDDDDDDDNGDGDDDDDDGDDGDDGDDDNGDDDDD